MARSLSWLMLLVLTLPCGAQRDVRIVAHDVPENPNSAFEIDVDVDKPERWYRPGDKLTISVAAQRACYVTIFDVGTSDNVTVLLPNRYRSDNRIEAGECFRFPGQGDGFEYTIEGPEGLERLVVVGTERPVNLVASDLATYDSRSPFLTVAAADARGLMDGARDVLLSATGSGGDWASDQVTFHIGTPPTGPTTPTPPTPQQSRIWVFAAAVADYPGEVNDLTYTTSDAKVFASVMQQRYGVTADRVRLSLDADATQSGIEAGLDWLAQNAGANDRVYIFYSGHGNTGPDDNGDEDDGIDEFICAYDDNVRDDDFGQWTKRIKCSNVVTFIDTCFSGGAGRGIKSISDGARTMQRRPTDGFEQMEWRAAVRKRTRELAPEGFTMFAASRPEQPSQESAQLQQGVFTHFLRKGLEGEADANRDGHLTLRELFDYTRREVARFTGNEQQPALLPDNAELTIAP